MSSTPTKTIAPMTPDRAKTVVGVVLDDRDEHTAAAQLDQMLQRPGYRHHLTDACAATQEILLGHADAAERAAAAGTLDAVAIKHGVTLRFRTGTMDGAGTMVALVDARTALATPTKRRALADENRRRADADAALKETLRDDASDASGSTLLVNSLDEDASASTAPLLRLDDETCAPPSSPLIKPRKRERGCWCRG